MSKNSTNVHQSIFEQDPGQGSKKSLHLSPAPNYAGEDPAFEGR